MQIALIGYGKMGKEVELAARNRGITVARIFEIDTNTGAAGMTRESLSGVDVCIDFSSPMAVMDNIHAAAECGTNIVVGTTGWYDRVDDVRALVHKKNIGFLYSANFSLGVNLFLQIVGEAAQLIDPYPEYDAAISETHHRGKADSPSGTALSLANSMVQAMKRKSEIVTDVTRGPIRPEQLHVSSVRVGAVTGTHAVVFDSDADTIELVHRAKSRRGFASGVIAAAEWLKGKKGFYTMRDVILP